MSDLLAILSPTDSDDALLAEIVRRHPDRVTVLVESADPVWTREDSPRGLALAARLSRLTARIDALTGTVLVGLADSREQLSGWRFDRVLAGGHPGPAVPVPAR